MLKIVAPPKIKQLQFMFAASIVEKAGQNEKNSAIEVYIMAMIVIGTPNFLSRKGPHGISDAGVVNLFVNITLEASKKDDWYAAKTTE